MTVEVQHIETVGCNVVGGTGESHEEEEEHRALKPERSIQRKGHTGERQAQ